ncbi:MAG TPA: methylmalonyl Co-A mutase-associated GTPase MeaB [Ohtaekwangia sp.]
MALKTRFTIDYYQEGILQNNRVVLAQAITLIESTLPADQTLAGELLDRVLNQTGKSIRIGITGVPGAGKSTFIESLGNQVAEADKKLAILTIDPSSQLTRGSILGDKTRMETLSKNSNVFIRPTASGNTLGGVGSRTREAILLCEAAGYSIIIIETVGVGQSEVAIKKMVDFFLLLMLAGAGDELQGIKKGIMEMADAVVITKADGDNIKQATQAQADYSHALHLFAAGESGWQPKVLTSSALTGKGIMEIWQMIEGYVHQTKTSGFFDQNRVRQNISWFHEHFDQLLRTEIMEHNQMQKKIQALTTEIQHGNISSYTAAQQLLNEYHQVNRGSNS